MKKLIALTVALAFPLAACSADQPAATTAAVAPTSTAAPQDTRVAQANQANPAATVTAQTPDAKPVQAGVKPAATAAAAGAQQFQQGKDYLMLPSTQPTSSSAEKIEVAEVFMYSCPHCYSLEPFISSYRESMPANVSFVRIPANFNAMARLHSRAYYAAEALDVNEKTHEAFFQELHVKKNMLKSEDELVKFFASQGVDADTFRDAMNSFGVDAKVRRADDLARRYRIRSVPSIVVNGKYVTQASMTGSLPRLRQVVDYLVAKESETP